MLFFLNVVLF